MIKKSKEELIQIFKLKKMVFTRFKMMEKSFIKNKKFLIGKIHQKIILLIIIQALKVFKPIK